MTMDNKLAEELRTRIKKAVDQEIDLFLKEHDLTATQSEKQTDDLTTTQPKKKTIVRKKNTKNSVEEPSVIVTNYVFRLGFQPHLIGYDYIRDAILMILDNPESLHNITKVLYPTVAKNRSTTPSRVERAIRHSIECAFRKGGQSYDELDKIFGTSLDPLKKKPTNSEFLAMVAEQIRFTYPQFRD